MLRSAARRASRRRDVVRVARRGVSGGAAEPPKSSYPPLEWQAPSWPRAKVPSESLVYTYGMGFTGQLGHGGYERVERPTCVSSLSHQALCTIRAGWTRTVGIARDGRLVQWGWDGDIGSLTFASRQHRLFGRGLETMQQYGVLGLGLGVTPRVVRFPAHERVVDCALASDTTAAVCASGNVYVWGYSFHGLTGGRAGEQLPTVEDPELMKVLAFPPEKADGLVAGDAWRRRLANRYDLDIHRKLADVRRDFRDRYQHVTDPLHADHLRNKNNPFGWDGLLRSGSLGQAEAVQREYERMIAFDPYAEQQLHTLVQQRTDAHLRACGVAVPDHLHGTTHHYMPSPAPSLEQRVRDASRFDTPLTEQQESEVGEQGAPRARIALEGETGGEHCVRWLPPPCPYRRFRTVGASFYTFSAVDDEGEAWSWGRNAYGEFGIVHDDLSAVGQSGVSGPVKSDAVQSRVRPQDRMKGRSHFEQITVSSVPQPVRSSLTRDTGARMPPIVQACGGFKHMVWLDDEGSVWCAGDNTFGQLGSHDFVNSNIPQRVETLRGQKIVKIASGQNHCAALNDRGEVFTWGLAMSHQLGRQLATEGRLNEAHLDAGPGMRIMWTMQPGPLDPKVVCVSAELPRLFVGRPDAPTWEIVSGASSPQTVARSQTPLNESTVTRHSDTLHVESLRIGGQHALPPVTDIACGFHETVVFFEGGHAVRVGGTQARAPSLNATFSEMFPTPVASLLKPEGVLTETSSGRGADEKEHDVVVGSGRYDRIFNAWMSSITLDAPHARAIAEQADGVYVSEQTCELIMPGRIVYDAVFGFNHAAFLCV